MAAFALCWVMGCNGTVSLGKNVGPAGGGGRTTDSTGTSVVETPDASATTTASTGTGGGGAVIFRDGGYRTRAPDQDSGGCVAVRQETERLIVFTDARVADATAEHVPAAIAFMLDRSSAMSGVDWNTTASAITAFVDDPASAGLDVGLGTFPVGASNSASCDGTDCGALVVPFGPLPGNRILIDAALLQQGPTGAGVGRPTECALRGMIDSCLSFEASSPTGEGCVAVLVTDGAPTECDTNDADLAQIVANGKARGVPTYVIALPGADASVANALAVAGGTNAAIDVSGGAQTFTSALQRIRNSISITYLTTITTRLACDWTIPPAPPGATFDPSKVNVEFMPPNGPAVILRNVPSASDCARTDSPAWYYADPRNPATIIACPVTCDTLIQNSGGSVEIVFGCDVIPAPIR